MAQSRKQIFLLWKLSLLIWFNRIRSKKSKLGTVLLFLFCAAFFGALFIATRQLVAQKLVSQSELKLVGTLQIASIATMLMLIFGNFATALQGFYGAFDIPYLLALPLSRFELMLGRASSTVWNASWTTMLFCIPLCAGFLIGTNAPLVSILITFGGLVVLTVLCGLLGIIGATIFVNLVPTSRMLEFFVVVMTVFILFLAAVSPELGPQLPPASANLRKLGEHFEQNPYVFLAFTPPGIFAQMLLSSKAGVAPLRELTQLVLWLVSVGAVSGAIFSKLFLRGWNLTFAGRPRQRILETKKKGSLSRIFEQQLMAIVTKELKMFIRDPAQAIQFLVILLLTFLYLFNLKNLRNLSFSAEEGTYWWQATLGLANISMGGCVAAAMATRFVFPSVSMEGRAYPVLMVTPIEVPRLLFAKCVAWFWPTCLVNTVLLLSGAMALQLPPLALLYTFIISISLSLGLVGLGVGMGAVYARFDWDQSSSINSSLGALLYMLFAFILILITLLPSGFLFMTACVPAFANQLGIAMQFGPVAVSLLILLLMNFLVARGALKSGSERLREC